MEYCKLHKDLSDEEGDGCPLCESMVEHENALARWAEIYRTQKDEPATAWQRADELKDDLASETKWANHYFRRYGEVCY